MTKLQELEAQLAALECEGYDLIEEIKRLELRLEKANKRVGSIYRSYHGKGEIERVKQRIEDEKLRQSYLELPYIIWKEAPSYKPDNIRFLKETSKRIYYVNVETLDTGYVDKSDGEYCPEGIVDVEETLKLPRM